MFLNLFCFLLLLSLSFQFTRTSLGDQLHVTFPDFQQRPTTMAEAQSLGWVRLSDKCEKGLGVPFVPSSKAPSDEEPVTFYFTPGGQLSGVGLTVYGTVPDELLERGVYTKSGWREYYTTVAFRSEEEACSSSQLTELLGDRLIVQPQGINQELPLLESEADDNQWTRGSCIDQMGVHYSYDLDTAPVMSFDEGSFLPIVPMYWDGKIYAFFLTSSDWQSKGWWEMKLTGGLMNFNFCPKDGWSSGFSTMHFFLRNYDDVSCGCGREPACCI